MAKQDRRDDGWRSKIRRRGSAIGRLDSIGLRPEQLEARRLLAVAINEFGGPNTVTNPDGITLGSDGNLWFTESNVGAGAIGRISPSGAIRNFSTGLTPGATPTGIASGSDGALWFTDPANDSVGRIDTAGDITEFVLTTLAADPDQIASGPDGALWFTERDGDKIGRITTAGSITQYAVPTAGSQPTGIAAGPDDALWFTESTGDKIGRITTAGAVTEFAAGITPASGPEGITLGPDGNLWFTQPLSDQVAQITTAGAVTEFGTGVSPGAAPAFISTGPDSRLWFTEPGVGKIGAISTVGAIIEYADPSISPSSGLAGISSGPDGNLWFTELDGNHVDRITTLGTTTQFPPAVTLAPSSDPAEISQGPDGALWFTETAANKIGRIDTSGSITEFSNGITGSAGLGVITEGPAGVGAPSLYFTESNANQIGQITTAGVVSEFPIPVAEGTPSGITLGPDNNLWLTENNNSGSESAEVSPSIVSLTSTGTLVDDYAIPGQYSGFILDEITTGPDNALWFTMSSPGDGGVIGRVTTSGQFSFYAIDNGGNGAYTSEPIGIVAGATTADGLWFADTGNHAIGHITTTGTITEYTQGLGSSDIPYEITADASGNYWFSDPNDLPDPVGEITPQGAITLYQTPTSPAGPMGIARGSDDNIWFTESFADQIGQVVVPSGLQNPLGENDVSVFEKTPSTYVLATFADGLATNITNFTATIDYGDGATLPGSIVADPTVPGGYEVIGSHSYGSAGTFTAKITIGTGTGSLPLLATVNSLNPIQVQSNDVDGIVGRRTNTLVATFTDLDTSATLADFTATIGWDDGTTSAGVVYLFTSTAGGPQYAVYAGHVFQGGTMAETHMDSITITDTRYQLTSVANPPSIATVAPEPANPAYNEFGPDNLTPGAAATAIVAGPDGNLWFTEDNSGKIGRITTAGVVTEFPITTAFSQPTGITSGPGNALWFTESNTGKIGMINPITGIIQEFDSSSTLASRPGAITEGPDGNLWFTQDTQENGAEIGMYDPTTQQFAEFPLPAGYQPDSITKGPGMTLWFVGGGSNAIGLITLQGTQANITFPFAASTSGLLSITEDHSGNLWFTENSGNKIGTINTSTNTLTEYADPLIVSPVAITDGPDGDLYFTAGGASPEVDRITTAGVVTPFAGGLTLNSGVGGIATGGDKNIYFTEQYGDRIGQLILPGSLTNASGRSATVVATISTTFEIATFVSTSLGTTASNFTANIDFGDGTSGLGTIMPVTGSPGEFAVFATHAFDSVRTFRATITIGTGAGSLPPVTSTIMATNPITLTGQGIQGIVGERSNTLVATFTDLDPSALAPSFFAIVSWSDGTQSTGFVYQTGTSDLSSSFAIYAGHAFAGPGVFANTVTLIQTTDDFSTSTTSTATIAAAPAFTPFNEIGPDSLTPGAGATAITLGPDAALWFTEDNSGMIGRMDTSGDVTEFPITTLDSRPTGITSGPGGALWFTESAAGQIGEITTAGVVSEFTSDQITDAGPGSITEGADGNLWFTLFNSDQIGVFNPTTIQFTEYALPAGFEPDSITEGPNGILWFVGAGSGEIGQITTQGVITLHSGASGVGISSITEGPDRNLWFTEPTDNRIGTINSTNFGVIEYGGASIVSPVAITSGPDGTLYFTGGQAIPEVGRITTSGVVTTFSNGLTLGSDLGGIAAGPDGNLYFTEAAGDRIGQLVLPQTSTTLSGTEINAVQGQTFNGTVATFTEASTIPTTANFEAMINWGDGTPTVMATVVGSDGQFSVQGSHLYPRFGPYGVTITIFNDAGSKSELLLAYAQSAISVTALPVDVRADQTFTLPVATFTDAGAPRPPGSYILTIEWGDGTTSLGTLGTGANGQLEVIGTHRYTIAGTYDISTFVTVATNPQLIGSSMGFAGVTARALFASPAAVSAFAGQVFLGTVAYVIDSDSQGATASSYQAAINWGDGTPSVGGTIVPLNASTFEVVGSHVYATAGQFPVTVLVVKPSTDDSALVTGIANVAMQPPLTFVVTNTNDSGPGSLRQVIINADSVGGHAITFAVPTAGVATIGVDSALPPILGPTVIDGPSQAEFEGVTPSHTLIEIDGRGAGAGAVDGLSFGGNSAGSLVYSVSIFGFSGAQVQVESPDITLFGNLVGLRADGTIPTPLGGGHLSESFVNRGVDVVAPGAVIGGPDPGEGNIISGNPGWGILVNGGPASSTRIYGDLIGLDPTGSVARPNLLDGVALIGGASHAFVGPGNTISGNSGNGVLTLGSSSDLIAGNAIGTAFGDERAIANGDYGIDLDQQSTAIQIGGTDPLSTNIVSGNTVVGVGIQGGSTGILLESNRIGTDGTGELALGNGIAGVLISDSPGNIVGPENLVSGNGISSPGAGIWVDGPDSTTNLIFGNKVGTDLSGQFPLGNSEIGVLINQGSGNQIGGGTTGVPNVISGNTSIGVMIAGSTATRNLVAGNLIGTNAEGSAPVGNGSSTQGAGVYIDDASGNAIGGPGGLGNLISGNNFDGIQVFGPASIGTLIESNGIGTDLSGTARLGNGDDGLLINGAPSTQVIGNILAANALDGITVAGPGSTGTLLRQNTIGQGIGGQPLGNSSFGILVINGAPSPAQVGNINVNNTLGPIRDTGLASNTVSTASAPTSSATSTAKPKKVAVIHGHAKPSNPRPIQPKASKTKAKK